MPHSVDSVPELSVGSPVRFTSGRYHGYEGILLKLCDAVCSVSVNYEGKPVELVDELHHLTALAAWRAGKSKEELALKGHAL